MCEAFLALKTALDLLTETYMIRLHAGVVESNDTFPTSSVPTALI